MYFCWIKRNGYLGSFVLFFSLSFKFMLDVLLDREGSEVQIRPPGFIDPETRIDPPE